MARAPQPFGVTLRMKWTGLRALARHVGWPGALTVGLAAEAAPDPFAHLPKPGSAVERLSRAQIAPAVCLYQVLLTKKTQAEALTIAKDVITPATLLFLKHAIGSLDIPRYRTASEPARRDYLNGVAARFFNADSQLDAISNTGFVHRVTNCRFVALCAAAGVPELAPVFCEGDMHFFAQGPVTLTRNTTLAQGGDCCEFRFELSKK